MPRRLFAPAAALTAVALAAGQPAAKDPTFRVDVRGMVTLDVGGEEKKFESDTAYEYTWRRDGKERTLLVEAQEVRVVSDGKETTNTRMSRAGVTITKDGRTTEVRAEDAPPAGRRVLADSYGAPISKLEVDAAGREVKRTMLAGPGADQMVRGGMVTNATLFHPPYLADRDEWQADMGVSTGYGPASGKATYTKVPGGKGGQAVKVAATLSADGLKGAGGLTIKGGKYVVAGEQTYDPGRKEWVAGKLTVGVAYALANGADEVGRAKGEMVLTFGVKPGK